MKRVVLLVALAVALLAIVGGSAAYAQELAIFNLSFKFTAGKSVLEPGRYTVTVAPDQATITLTPQRGTAVVLPALTRLAQVQVTKDAKVVFDRVGEQYTLSEVWLPLEDGFLLYDMKALHKHHIVPAEPRK